MLRDVVEAEIRTIENSGVFVPVQRTEWATVLVVIREAENQARLCNDYKATVNPCLKTDHCVLPVVEYLSAALAEGKVLTALDFTTAYQHLELHCSSKPVLAINTH